MPEITPTIAPELPASEPADRVARYAARLDEHLAGLPDGAARRAFLTRETEVWVARYDRFCFRVEEGDEPHFGESATDYTLTLCEISSRKSRYTEKVPA